eukprot:TRINITY_DN59_c0_g1_i8.p1 TRINITY_DN59_c0_g1~~TRINITY_DN59_c0_g1_i8.p1  ORF type:complete len:297 (-),score=68.96 TRINITY_DN59_c0_g1_i8:788-1678(-)
MATDSEGDVMDHEHEMFDGDGEGDGGDDMDVEEPVAAPPPVRKPRAPRRRPDVDPARPKAPRTAFMEFTNDHRQELLDDQPDLAKNVKAIASIMGAKWRELPKEDQDKYKTEYAEKKRHYDTALASYFESHPGAKDLEIEAKRRRKAEVSRKRSRAAGKGAASGGREKGPKKPLIPFFFFVMKQRPIVKAEMPHAKPTEITTAVAERWRMLTEDDKREFQIMAENDKERYQRECEEVGYHPPASKRARRTAAPRPPPVHPPVEEADDVGEEELEAHEEELDAGEDDDEDPDGDPEM